MGQQTIMKSRRLDLIFISFGLAVVAVFADRSPSHAIALNRTDATETNSIVLELLRQKSQTAFDRVEQDISVVRKALGLPDIKDSISRSSNLPVYFSSYQYQYQYREGTDPLSTVDRPVPQATEVLANISNAFSQLNFSRTVAATPQIQTLAQSSVETVDEDVYYYESSLGSSSTGGEEGIVSTILRNSQAESSRINNLLPAQSRIFARALTNEIAGAVSFFSGIQRIRQVGNSFESRQLQLGEIESVVRAVNASFSTSSIEKSPYQIALEQQNQRYAERQERQQEQLTKQLEREEEQRNREEERVEKQRQDKLEDAAKKRQDRLSQLQKSRQSQKRK
jgi:hypothetical protein